ncbi:acyl-CoA dehydrogenase family protein [Nonomuraea sp. NPDC050643]|uniref:acyl-CoA dehydrogenase family protein n=1 Tax=Nonomuraea sp. NPDC050643 TaxID=3155660 RepID=UPI0033EA5F7D
MENLLTEAEAGHHREVLSSVGATWAADSRTWERDERLPEEVVAWCSAEGLLGAMIPREYGGLGWSAVELGLLYEALGRVSASLASLVNVHGMVAQTLVRWGSGRQREELLPELAAGRKVAAVSMTERQAGSDLSRIETTLTGQGSGHVLDGTKLYTTFGQRADLYLVYARAAGGPVWCLLDRTSPGLTISPVTGLLGLRAAQVARVDMRGCPIEPDAVVGKPGFAQSILLPHTLEHGRYAVAWMAVGMLSSALASCSAAVLERRAFGHALVEYGQIQNIVTAMGVDLEAARALCVQASRALAAGDPTSTRRVLMAKYFACQALERHAAQAVQAMGARGALEDEGASRIYRDAKVLNIIEGTPQLLERLLTPQIAREAAGPSWDDGLPGTGSHGRKG